LTEKSFSKTWHKKLSPSLKRFLKKLRRLKEEAKRQRTNRRQYVGELRAEKYRVKKHYTLTSRVGTMWILAGHKLDAIE